MDAVQSETRIIAAIPCYNTESFAAALVAKARKYVDRVIIIDDGSSDATATVATTAGALVVRHGKNRGYGAALASCFEAARANSARAMVILDGDGQHDADDIPLVLAPVLRGDADIVIGSRFLVNRTNMPRYRRFGIGVITWLFNLGSRTRVTDAQSGFRSYSRTACQDIAITETGMGASIEIVEKARGQGLKFAEVPISCRYEAAGPSLMAVRHGLGVAFAVVRIRLKNSFRLDQK